MTSPTILPYVSRLKQFTRRLRRFFRRHRHQNATPRPSPLNQDAVFFLLFNWQSAVCMCFFVLQ